jgi:hypothetical protein
METKATVTTVKMTNAYPTTCPKFTFATNSSFSYNSYAYICVTFKKYSVVQLV